MSSSCRTIKLDQISTAFAIDSEVFIIAGDTWQCPDDCQYRAPTMTLTHRGGVDIEELGKHEIATVPFDALTGLKAFVVANALTDIGAPKEIISPLVRQLPKLWELMHQYGMTTLELNPIRMRPGRNGRLTPIACDFKCGLGSTSFHQILQTRPPTLDGTLRKKFEQWYPGMEGGSEIALAA